MRREKYITFVRDVLFVKCYTTRLVSLFNNTIAVLNSDVRQCVSAENCQAIFSSYIYVENAVFKELNKVVWKPKTNLIVKVSTNNICFTFV
jgi:hypothetical protein